MSIKKIISLAAATAMAVTVLTGSMTVFAEELPSGSCGDGVIWTWEESTKTLTFSGNGDITNAEEYQKYADITEHIVLESGITRINATTVITSEAIYGAFYGFKMVKDIQFSDDLTEIGNGSFYEVPLNKISLPKGLLKIGDHAFYNCPLEGELVLPNTLNFIGQYAFSGTNITSINSFNEEMTIRGFAFRECNSIKEVTLPKNINYLRTAANPPGSNAMFYGCNSLEKIIIEGGGTIRSRFELLSQNGITEDLCNNCTSLNTVIIKDNVDYIDNFAFAKCPSLTNIYLFNTDLNTITAKGTPSGKNYFLDSFDTTNNPTFHIIKDSTTEQTLRDAGYLIDATDETKANYVYLPNTTTLDDTIANAEKLDSSKYTEDSFKAVTEALEKAKALKENIDATQEEINAAAKALNDAINALKLNNTTYKNPIIPPAVNVMTTRDVTRDINQVNNDKKQAKKQMKQAKITKLTVKNKANKKIAVSWKKVKKAKGYEVQVAAKKNFKKSKIIFKKFTTKKKFTIKNKKIKSKKTYYVRVRAYATYLDTYGNEQKVYSSWNKKIRKVKVK